MTADQPESSYFSSLFQTMDNYIGSVSGTTMSLTNNKDVKDTPKLFNFTPDNNATVGTFVNIAGNYKLSCVVPIAKGLPPNYIGMLREQKALNDTTFIYDLLSFTSHCVTEEETRETVNNEGKVEETKENVTKCINCTSTARELYRKMYKHGDVLSNTRCINFTQGMPYTIHSPALEKIHAEICEKLNDIIDYIIATGQTVNNNNTYNETLTTKMLRLFYTESELPKYYDLRLGILPSAINFIKKSMGSKENYTEDIDELKAGKRFIPAGRGPQFLDNADKNTHLYWYPFNTKDPYSYTYDYSAETLDTQYYIQHLGFNHYLFKGTDKDPDGLEAKFQAEVVNSTPGLTSILNSGFVGLAKRCPTVLSYESSLTDQPAVSAIQILHSENGRRNNKQTPQKECIGKTSDTIKAITNWAHPRINDQWVLHPLLNSDNKDKKYLYIKTENYDTKDPFMTKAAVIASDENKNEFEKMLYYNTGATFTPETYTVDRLNFYSSIIDDNHLNTFEKSCNVYDLEFAEITSALYDFSETGNELKVYSEECVSPNAFGVASQLGLSSNEADPHSKWQTFKVGITEILNGDASGIAKLLKNKLFDCTHNTSDNLETIPNVKMKIVSLEYNGAYDTDRDSGCYHNLDDDGLSRTCRPIKFLATGSRDYYETKASDNVRAGEDFNDNLTMSVEWSTNGQNNEKIGLRGTYDVSALRGICKVANSFKAQTDYYVTVHFLADDGQGGNMGIDGETGKPTFITNKPEIYEIKRETNTTKDTGSNAALRYGTGVAYFFGGNCTPEVFYEYWNRGLTVAQLLDPHSDIYTTEAIVFDKDNKISQSDSKRTNGKMINNTQDTKVNGVVTGETNTSAKAGYGRTKHGLRRANLTFEWDYDRVIEAWYLAACIMQGKAATPGGTTMSFTDGVSWMYQAKDVAVALEVFFDYIYRPSNMKAASQTRNSYLLLGPSLKQINNKLGPYVTGNDNKGNALPNDTALNKEGGIAYETMLNRAKAVHNREYNANHFTDKPHTLISSHILVPSHKYLYEEEATLDKKRQEYTVEKNRTLGKNGVNRDYWSKGERLFGGYGDRPGDDEKITDWGVHRAHGRVLLQPRGKLHLDHYSWDWNFGPNEDPVPDGPGKEYESGVDSRWKGAFMIHAAPANAESDKNEAYTMKPADNGGQFNWHTSPFHDVSSESRRHLNVYGTRAKASWWPERDDNMSYTSDINKAALDTVQWRQSWQGIIGQTNNNQNPNIRVRLPLLWRYLKALRSMNIFTDGQLMPCGVELHYVWGKKALMSSIHNVERILPLPSVADEAGAKLNLEIWQAACTDPAALVFAQVKYDTYAITRNTMATWYNMMHDPVNLGRLITDVIKTVEKHGDKAAAMYRAKRYIDNLPNIDNLKFGRTVYSLPVLPTISMFGCKDVTTAASDPLMIFGGTIPVTYYRPPDVDLKGQKVMRDGIGVMHPPVTTDESNQFTQISENLYKELLNFDANTIGWLVPIPTKSNLSLLESFNDKWRQPYSNIVPVNRENILKVITDLADKDIHWIGWIDSRHISCLTNEHKTHIKVCNEQSNSEGRTTDDNVVIPMASLKLLPYYSDPTYQACVNDGSDCTMGETIATTCNDLQPFTMQVIFDTRNASIDSLKLIMIRDKQTSTGEFNDISGYEIYNISKSTMIGGAKGPDALMTVVNYDKLNANILPEMQSPTQFL